MLSQSGLQLWQKDVTVWWPGGKLGCFGESFPMSVYAGLSSDAVHVLQRILQPPARGLPGCHNSGSRMEVGERGSGSQRQGADFH